MTDREKAGLRGPVRTYGEETIYPGGKFLTTTEYSLEGILLTTRISNPDGSEWVTAQTYDADGGLVKSVSGEAGESSFESVYAYDEAGRLLTIANSNENGGRTDFHYGEQGRKATIQTFDPKTLQRTQNSAFAGSPWDAALAGVGVPVVGKITTIYNENDQPTEAQILDAEGHVVSRFVRAYDADGRISEEKPIWEKPALMLLDKFSAEQRDQLTPEQIKLLSKEMSAILGGQAQAGTSYTYDTQGRIKKIRERNMVFERTTTITYNDQGDEAEERTTSTGNSVIPIGVSYSIDEYGTRIPSDPAAEPPASLGLPEQSEVRYAYQYDSYGNWTQQTVNDFSRPDEPSNVRHRKLTYY